MVGAGAAARPAGGGVAAPAGAVPRPGFIAPAGCDVVPSVTIALATGAPDPASTIWPTMRPDPVSDTPLIGSAIDAVPRPPAPSMATICSRTACAGAGTAGTATPPTTCGPAAASGQASAVAGAMSVKTVRDERTMSESSGSRY